MGLLQKISWKTRRWNFKINLLDIFLHDGNGCWGFTLLEIVKDYNSYSLLAFEFRLPNGADIKKFKVDNFDILFIGGPLKDWEMKLDDRILWGHKPTILQRIGLKIVRYIF